MKSDLSQKHHFISSLNVLRYKLIKLINIMNKLIGEIWNTTHARGSIMLCLFSKMVISLAPCGTPRRCRFISLRDWWKIRDNIIKFMYHIVHFQGKDLSQASSWCPVNMQYKLPLWVHDEILHTLSPLRGWFPCLATMILNRKHWTKP